MISPVLDLAYIDEDKPVHQIERGERLRIVETLKRLPLTISGTRPIDEAIVTAGGVSVGALFMAGYLPGALLAIALMVVAGELIDRLLDSLGADPLLLAVEVRVARLLFQGVGDALRQTPEKALFLF